LENFSQSQFGPFLIDIRERVLRRDGRPVPLTPKAFDVLVALVEQPGQLLSKQELLDKVWPDTFVEESNLAYNVFTLRKALGDPADSGHYIETVPRRGYRFTAPVVPVNGGNGPQPLPEDAAESLVSEAVVGPGHRRYQTMADLPGVRNHRAPEPSWTAQAQVSSSRSSLSRRWAWVALVPALAAAYLAVHWWRATTEPLRALPLTSMPGVVRSPSLSPDGRHVVFIWTGKSQTNPDLYVQQIDAGPPLQLTTDPGNDYSPSWSPDGRTIAFLRRAPGGGSSEVRLIAPLGGPERLVGQLQPRLANFRPPSLGWCPDSTCVVVTDAAGDGETDAVFIVFLESGEKRQLTHAPKGADSDPAISPDGRSLIFRRDSTPFSGEFYRVSLKDHMVPDGEPVRLTSTLIAGKPFWMPDSREFLFAAHGGLWRLGAFEAGSPMRLPFVGQDGQTPVVSKTADGRLRLVYVRSFTDGNIWRVDLPSPGAPASSAPVTAIGSTRFDGIPSLSSDGLRLAFLSNRSGDFEIWVSSPDGSNAVPVTALGVLPGFPRWSPDGQLIAFHGDPRARPDVLVVPARGGKPKILETDSLNGAYPTFSRDGRWIYFCGGQAGTFRIFKMPVSGGATVQVTSNRGSIAIESHGGRDLYYVSDTDRPSPIWRLPLAGGEAVKMLDGVVLGNFDVADGGIYYIDRVSGEAGAYFTDRPSGETRLQYFDFATGQSNTVARDLGAVTFGLSASRDGRTVFFSRVDSSVDELMLVDNFR
jgi:Tol biopolymer transport system component/DNA-binding winged helix-turn-helix (wHTH) protein